MADADRQEPKRGLQDRQHLVDQPEGDGQVLDPDRSRGIFGAAGRRLRQEERRMNGIHKNQRFDTENAESTGSLTWSLGIP